MIGKWMSSRQRMLAAIHHQEVDYPPCSFMLFKALSSKCSSYLEFIQRQMDLGLDSYVQIPPRPPLLQSDTYNLYGLPVTYHPEVSIREWKEYPQGERWPIMYKEYETPAGTLRAEVNQDEEWPYGDHVPFLDDYMVTRSRKFILSRKEELDAFRFLLQPPTKQEITAFRVESQPVLDFARRNDLLITGGWGVGADLVGWVLGLEEMIFASYDARDFLHELLELIAEWNRKRMQVVLDAGVDLYIKRAWYENCDFWSPKLWQEYIYPILKADVDLTHASGVNFGYLITANCMPLLDRIADCGVDVIIGADPAKWNLVITKQKLKGKVCIWGGVNGHLTVEQGTLEQVRKEVRAAMEICSPGSGFILSPVDNVRENTNHVKNNVQALIDQWRRCTVDRNSSTP
jgi:uroporphyrinogen-III decarboxylase